MKALALCGVGFVGTLFWPVSPDAAVAYAATSGAWHPLALGLLVASGQVVAQVLLFLFGTELRRRWGWFDRQCQRVRSRYAARFGGGLGLLAASSGLLGLPPTSVTAALAPGLGFKGTRLIPIMFAMRVIRFTVLASAAVGVRSALLAH
jgi:hypothetical protein